jgi:putative membrane protein
VVGVYHAHIVEKYQQFVQPAHLNSRWNTFCFATGNQYCYHYLKKIFMKQLTIRFLLFSGVYFLSACNGEKSTTQSTSIDSTNAATSTDTTSKSTATDTTSNNAGNQAVDQSTKDFVAEAATGGMMEVELGNLAQQKAASQQVKDFGKMMVDDHTQANNNLKAIASQKNIDVPAAVTDNQKKDIDDLSKKSGADFDKAYVDMMVDDHKKDVDAFKKASGSLGDNDVRNFATTTLPTLQKHLDSIQAIKSKAKM